MCDILTVGAERVEWNAPPPARLPAPTGRLARRPDGRRGHGPGPHPVLGRAMVPAGRPGGSASLPTGAAAGPLPTLPPSRVLSTLPGRARPAACALTLALPGRCDSRPEQHGRAGAGLGV